MKEEEEEEEEEEEKEEEDNSIVLPKSEHSLSWDEARLPRIHNPT